MNHEEECDDDDGDRIVSLPSAVFDAEDDDFDDAASGVCINHWGLLKDACESFHLCS